MIEATALAAHLDGVLQDATIPELPNHYRGKVRDNYDLPDGRRIIIASDRLSAFDRIVTSVPCKGQVLTQIARFWFDKTRDICPNHVLEYPDPNVLVCRRLAIMPVEIVVRDYLTGTTETSIWPMYRAGRREIYGIRFPDGLRENQKLPSTIITPTTKASEGGHDAPLSERTLRPLSRPDPANPARGHPGSRADLHRGVRNHHRGELCHAAAGYSGPGAHPRQPCPVLLSPRTEPCRSRWCGASGAAPAGRSRISPNASSWCCPTSRDRRPAICGDREIRGARNEHRARRSARRPHHPAHPGCRCI